MVEYDKEPSHYAEFPGVTQAVYELLSLSSHISNEVGFTVTTCYKNPFHHFAIVRHPDKRIGVYMDGDLLDPENLLNTYN